MPGKIVACDQDGFVMPAEFAAGIAAATTVVYTANDVTAGTIDIATGSAVTVAKTVTLTQIDGTRGAGWTAANAGVAAGATSSFMGRSLLLRACPLELPKTIQNYLGRVNAHDPFKTLHARRRQSPPDAPAPWHI